MDMVDRVKMRKTRAGFVSGSQVPSIDFQIRAGVKDTSPKRDVLGISQAGRFEKGMVSSLSSVSTCMGSEVINAD